MEENHEGDVDPQNDEDTVVIDPFDDEGARKLVASQIAIKKHWREKAQKIEAENKVLAEELKKYKPALQEKPVVEDDYKKKIDSLSLAEEKRQFGYEHGLSPEETDEVFAYSTGRNIKPAEAKEKPFVKAAIEALRAQRRSESATPSPSSGLPAIDGKSWSEMSNDERKANFSKIMGGKK